MGAVAAGATETPGTSCVRCDHTTLSAVAQVLSDKKHKAAAETDTEREKGQVQGMAIAKKAVEGRYYSRTSLRVFCLICATV